MIVGVGTDICEKARIAEVWEKSGERFLNRLLTEIERGEEWTADRLARRWALKEAVAKACGTGIGAEVGFQEIEVTHRDNGAPVVVVRGQAGYRVHASVSDDGGFAVAFAVVEREVVAVE